MVRLLRSLSLTVPPPYQSPRRQFRNASYGAHKQFVQVLDQLLTARPGGGHHQHLVRAAVPVLRAFRLWQNIVAEKRDAQFLVENCQKWLHIKITKIQV